MLMAGDHPWTPTSTVLVNGELQERFQPRTKIEQTLAFALLEIHSQMLFSLHHVRNDFRKENTNEEAPG